MPRQVINGKAFIPAWSVFIWWRQLLACNQYVLDYGTGNLRNALFLRECEAIVWALDLPRQLARLKDKGNHKDKGVVIRTVNDINGIPGSFSGMVCTYVLNIVPTYEQERIIDIAKEKLVRGGALCVEVPRSWGDSKKSASLPRTLINLLLNKDFQLKDVQFGKNWLAHLYISR